MNFINQRIVTDTANSREFRKRRPYISIRLTVRGRFGRPRSGSIPKLSHIRLAAAG